MLLLHEHWPLFGTQPSLYALRSIRMRWVSYSAALCAQHEIASVLSHEQNSYKVSLSIWQQLAEGPRPHHEEVGEIVVQARKRDAVCVQSISAH